MINSRIRSLASMLICSLMLHAPLAAVSAPSKEDFHRFKSMLLEKAKMVPSVAAIPARDMATMWRYGVKKVTGKVIAVQEKEKFDLALKRTGLPVVVVIGVIGTVLASAKLYNKYTRVVKPSDEGWVGEVVRGADEKRTAAEKLSLLLNDPNHRFTQNEVEGFLLTGLGIDSIWDRSGRTLLMRAVQACDKDLIAFLLKKGANPNTISRNNDVYNKETPLSLALVQKCDQSILEMLIDAGAYIKRQEVATAFILRITKLDEKVIKYLVDSGLDINATTVGRNAVGEATILRDFDRVKFLIANGAVPSVAATLMPALTISGSKENIINYCIDNMSDDQLKEVVTGTSLGRNALGRPSTTSFVVNTPLMQAILNNYRTVVKKLLERGIDPNITNHAKYSPLSVAINQKIPELAKPMVALLFQYGAKPTAEQLRIPWVRDLYNMHIFKRAHQSGTHPQIGRLPRELLGEIEKELE